MNILPHKSWHVRTKKNIARVRRDEEKAQKEEDEKLRRINLAEHESRIALLKSKNGISVQPVKKDVEPSFNLFDNFKDKVAQDSEKESEKRVDQEKWEVKAGIFNYLDGRYKYQNDKEEQWYIKSHEERFSSNKDGTETLKDHRAKQCQDPLIDIKRHLAEMKKIQSTLPTSQNTSYKTVPKAIDLKQEITSPLKKTKVKNKKHKKDSKDKRQKHKTSKHRSRSRNDTSESSSDEQSKSQEREALIHRLRQERLEREKKERLRTGQLLQGPVSNLQVEMPTQKYSSQFNPHIARQNQPQ